jgi:ADP-ribosylglycohydrolase
MSTIQNLTEKREKLIAQIKQIDTAIKKEKEREQQQKSKAIFDAMAARGLGEKDLDSILAAIASAEQKPQFNKQNDEAEALNSL